MAHIIPFELDVSDDAVKSDAVKLPSHFSYIGLAVPSIVDGDVTLEILMTAQPEIDKLTHALGSLGSELVSNGTFDSDTAGWTAEASTLSSVAGGQAGNCLQVAASGAASGFAKATITTVVGKYYLCTFYFKQGTSATGSFHIGTTAKGTDIFTSGGLNDAAWTQYQIGFRSTQATIHLTCKTDDATATETSLFDTISVKQCSELDPRQDDDWVPVIDNSDGQDAVVNANTYDPGVTDITSFVGAFGGMWMRVVTAGTQTSDVTFYLIYQ